MWCSFTSPHAHSAPADPGTDTETLAWNQRCSLGSILELATHLAWIGCCFSSLLWEFHNVSPPTKPTFQIVVLPGKHLMLQVMFIFIRLRDTKGSSFSGSSICNKCSFSLRQGWTRATEKASCNGSAECRRSKVQIARAVEQRSCRSLICVSNSHNLCQTFS